MWNQENVRKRDVGTETTKGAERTKLFRLNDTPYSHRHHHTEKIFCIVTTFMAQPNHFIICTYDINNHVKDATTKENWCVIKMIKCLQYKKAVLPASHDFIMIFWRM